MPPAGFEPAIPASERPSTHALDRAAFGVGRPLGLQVVNFGPLFVACDRLCGLVVRVSGYSYRGLGFDSWRYQIF